MANNRSRREFCEVYRERGGIIALPSGVQYLSLASRSGAILRSSDVAVSYHAIDNIHSKRVAGYCQGCGRRCC